MHSTINGWRTVDIKVSPFTLVPCCPLNEDVYNTVTLRCLHTAQNTPQGGNGIEIILKVHKRHYTLLLQQKRLAESEIKSSQIFIHEVSFVSDFPVDSEIIEGFRFS